MISFVILSLSEDFEAINNTSSDAESREEQNGASRFVTEATMTKLWPLF